MYSVLLQSNNSSIGRGFPDIYNFLPNFSFMLNFDLFLCFFKVAAPCCFTIWHMLHHWKIYFNLFDWLLVLRLNANSRFKIQFKYCQEQKKKLWKFFCIQNQIRGLRKTLSSKDFKLFFNNLNVNENIFATKVKTRKIYAV